MEEGEEALGGFIVAGADAAKVFELIKHALDQVALLVEFLVIVQSNLLVRGSLTHLRLNVHRTWRPVRQVLLISVSFPRAFEMA
jgi:hypothetical protein